VLAEAEAAQSDVESMVSYLVDPAGGKAPPEAAADFGISQEKLDLVNEIFGDSSVLRPLGEVGEVDEEAAPPAVHASLAAAEAAAAVSMAAKQELDPSSSLSASASAPPAVLPVLTDSLDPDVLEKSYQLPKEGGEE
jgi:hypothetical protein